jgi:hypothetical protein
MVSTLQPSQPLLFAAQVSPNTHPMPRIAQSVGISMSAASGLCAHRRFLWGATQSNSGPRLNDSWACSWIWVAFLLDFGEFSSIRVLRPLVMPASGADLCARFDGLEQHCVYDVFVKISHGLVFEKQNACIFSRDSRRRAVKRLHLWQALYPLFFLSQKLAPFGG